MPSEMAFPPWTWAAGIWPCGPFSCDLRRRRGRASCAAPQAACTFRSMSIPRTGGAPLNVTAPPWLWVVFTLAAAVAQTFRNATQKGLTARLGTTGATHIRFLFGLPFGLVALLVVAFVFGELPHPNAASLAWTTVGALSQIAATALMLQAMRERSFVVTIAYTKTEPVQVALFAVVFLGERLTLSLAAAVLIATAGVVALSLAVAGGARDLLVAAGAPRRRLGRALRARRRRFPRRHHGASNAGVPSGGDADAGDLARRADRASVALAPRLFAEGALGRPRRVEAVASGRLPRRLRLGDVVPRLRFEVTGAGQDARPRRDPHRRHGLAPLLSAGAGPPRRLRHDPRHRRHRAPLQRLVESPAPAASPPSSA